MSPVFGHGSLRLYLLRLLDESPRHGYELIRLLEDRFLGLYSPSAGTIYPRLARLEEDGLIAHVEEGGRKTYELTEAGRRELAARAEDLARLESDVQATAGRLADEIRDDVRATVRDLRRDLKQAAKDVRREDRHTSRATGGTSARELERDIDAFRGEVRALVRRQPPSDQAVTAARAAVADARAAVQRALQS
ncbi:MAG: hypothetical protein QOG49_773 [Frankiaceae bacterium]|jgi:DNA-binding PadR family transcriptional regulator|nr:hypothetical protein [Frankiaceae bacterium]